MEFYDPRDLFHFVTPEEWELHSEGGYFFIPQCTALTRKGTRCKNPIIAGQIHTSWGEDEDSVPVVPLKTWAVIEAGLCPTHVQRNG